MLRPSAEVPVLKPGEYNEALLLALGQTTVKRASRVGELFQRSGALSHPLRAQVEPLDRILRKIRAGPHGEALGALLGDVAQRAFHRRPVLLLFGRQLKSCVQRGDARIAKGADVLCARPPAIMHEARSRTWTLLGVDERGAEDRKRGRAGQSCLPHELFLR